MAVKRVRIGDVLKPERLPVTPDPVKEYVSIGVRSFGKGIFHYESVPGDKLGKLRFFKLNPDRLVISNIKGWEGAISISSQGDAGTIASNRFLIYDAVDGAINLRWVRWFFLSEQGIELIRRASPSSADRNRTLAVSRFEDLVIPLPPIGEQRQTAARMERVSTTARMLTSRLERANELARATQVSLATGAGTGDAWVEVKLGDILAQSEMEVAVSPEAQYPLAGVYSFGRGLIDRGVISGSETSYRTFTRIGEGDIVVSKLNGWEGAIAVAPASFHGSYVSSEYPVFNVDRRVMLPGFFRGIARSPRFWDVLNRTVRGSMVRRRRISAADFMRATIRLPPLETQARISQAIDQLERMLDRSPRATARAAALTQAALNSEFGTGV